MMKYKSNSINPGLVMVKKVSVNKKSDLIIVPVEQNRYTTGVILEGEHKDEICRFVKMAGIEMENDTCAVPIRDIICLVELEEGDELAPFKGYQELAGNQDDWITVNSTAGKGNMGL